MIDVVKDKESGQLFVDSYTSCKNLSCSENSVVLVQRNAPSAILFKGPQTIYRPEKDVEVLSTVNIVEIKHMKEAIDRVMKLRVSEYKEGKIHIEDDNFPPGG
jgi:hypothetical protein